MSWVAPGGGMAIALVALGCGGLSVWTRGGYRVDGTAIAGIGLATLQVLFSLMLFGISAGGH